MRIHGRWNGNRNGKFETELWLSRLLKEHRLLKDIGQMRASLN